MGFRDLVGKSFFFYGVNGYAFKLDNDVWKVHRMNDERSERSMMSGISRIVSNEYAFFQDPIALVRIHEHTHRIGYEIIDIEYDHVWLRFGTQTGGVHTADFYFNYQPRDGSLDPIHRRKKYVYDPFDHFFRPRES